MKIMLFAGLILVVLGIASLFVPIPHAEKHGIKAGDVNIGVETTQSERVVANHQRCADRRWDCADGWRGRYAIVYEVRSRKEPKGSA